jgi:hypothetical protein
MVLERFRQVAKRTPGDTPVRLESGSNRTEKCSSVHRVDKSWRQVLNAPFKISG